MDQSTLIERLGQADTATAGAVFRAFIRGGVRRMIVEVMATEVESMAGPAYRPDPDAEFFRAGSAPGNVLHERKRVNVNRPRVRRKNENGRTEEVRLETYEAAREPGELEASMLRAIVAGVSGRDMAEVLPESPKTSRSSVSRHWAKVGGKFVEEIRERDIASQDWVVIMLDGIVLSKDQTAVVAIGITSSGEKIVLDFQLGSSENYETCRELLARITDRGFATGQRLFAVTDGSRALIKAVLKLFPGVVLQRCLVHKEWNLRAKLSKRDWGELARLFKRLRNVQSEAVAREVVGELEDFLATKNATALASLHEAGYELIGLFELEVPATLQKSLLSTNAIENTFRNVRRKLGRVTRFRAETDQASRWLACGLLEAEKGFRRIAGYRELWRLKSALAREPEDRAKKPPLFRHLPQEE